MSVTVSTFIDDCKKDLSGQHAIYPRHMAMYKNMVFAQDEVRIQNIGSVGGGEWSVIWDANPAIWVQFPGLTKYC